MDLSGDKLIVVVVVLSIILVGLALFLFYIERRLNNAEKKLDELRHKCTCQEFDDENSSSLS